MLRRKLNELYFWHTINQPVLLKGKMMIYKSLLSRLSWVVFLMLPAYLATAQSSADAGKDLFRNLCASCHNRNMVQDMTGPALGGVQERWADYPEEDLYAWIHSESHSICRVCYSGGP